MRLALLLILVCFGATQVQAKQTHANQDFRSDYIGQEKRLIKSLSADDIQQLKNGKGWGLAKAAELNGMPGPLHLLQMKKEISLSAEQEQKIQALYDMMKLKAVELGETLIDLEARLNHSFSVRNIDEKSLKQLLDEISDVRSQLRYVHLRTHLKTPDILSAHQIIQYNRLRGYSDGDPCKNIPKGHSEQMWKKHNGCN